MMSSRIYTNKIKEKRLISNRSIITRIGSIFLIILMLSILVFSLNLSVTSFATLHIPVRVIATDLVYSFLRVTIVAVMAWIVAILAGACINGSRLIRGLTMPTVNLLRHISPFAWFPFAIIWFGLGEYPIAFVLFITLFFPALVSTVEIFANIPREYIDEANICGANVIQQFYYIELPINLIQLINLFRVLWGVGWTMVIAAEMLGTARGLGYRLLDFRYLLHYEEMIVYIAIMGLVGVIVDEILIRIVKA